MDAPDQHLPNLLGIELDCVCAQSVGARLTIRPELLAPNGYLHAATLVALADTACGYGTLANLANPDASFTTLELKAQFLATARHGVLTCYAQCRHSGDTTQVWDAEVSCDRRTLVLFRCTQLVLRPRPTEADTNRSMPTTTRPRPHAAPRDQKDVNTRAWLSLVPREGSTRADEAPTAHQGSR